MTTSTASCLTARENVVDISRNHRLALELYGFSTEDLITFSNYTLHGNKVADKRLRRLRSLITVSRDLEIR